MRKTHTSPHLSVVGSALTGNEPPRPLGSHGQALWNSVTAEYDVTDVAGREFLCQAGQALDLAEALAERIREDGAVVRTPSGIKSHPSIKEELSARALEKGAYLMQELKALAAPEIAEIRGIGLLVGLDFHSAEFAHRFVAETISRGVIINWTLNADHVVRLAPPLAIVRSEIDIAVAAMRDALLGTRGRRGRG